MSKPPPKPVKPVNLPSETGEGEISESLKALFLADELVGGSGKESASGPRSDLLVTDAHKGHPLVGSSEESKELQFVGTEDERRRVTSAARQWVLKEGEHIPSNHYESLQSTQPLRIAGKPLSWRAEFSLFCPRGQSLDFGDQASWEEERFTWGISLPELSLQQVATSGPGMSGGRSSHQGVLANVSRATRSRVGLQRNGKGVPGKVRSQQGSAAAGVGGEMGICLSCLCWNASPPKILNTVHMRIQGRVPESIRQEIGPLPSLYPEYPDSCPYLLCVNPCPYSAVGLNMMSECSPDELYFEEGDIIYITDMSDTNWWKGTSKGKTGLIPSNYGKHGCGGDYFVSTLCTFDYLVPEAFLLAVLAEKSVESLPGGRGAVQLQLFMAGGGGSDILWNHSLHVVPPADSGTAENTLLRARWEFMEDEIDFKAQPNQTKKAKPFCSCFYKCEIFSGNLSWLRECLDNRVGVNGLDKAGSTALYWACHGGHKDVVEVLFTQPNIELNQQNKLGDTALHAAAWKGYADIVQLLLEKDSSETPDVLFLCWGKGARTDLRNNEKKLALDMATNATCASLLKKKQGTDAVRTLSNAEEYLDDEDSD
ncbi:hypothetical protein PANDA_021046 [Ailuropoda melanoleuca]|uniref:Osteoclast-stimulating factor 1 n=1 Tax=Ailuropoda melanoleuca TaxID=9646 RepID=D2I5R0_AILME|nr:hypothetical protein PANDA_021046 [Ailuropoda melanoleuca]